VLLANFWIDLKVWIVERLIQIFTQRQQAQKPEKQIPLSLSGLKINGSVAILVPHPDDEIIGCFHFMSRYGSSMAIDLIYVTEAPAKVLADLRRGESAEATKRLSISQRVCWGFTDGKLDVHRKDLRLRLEEINTRYDFIFCPAPSDLTPDHAVLAENAYALTSLDKLVWYRSTWWTFPLPAADFIVEGAAEEKRAALRCFKSQRNLALQNVVTLSGFEAAESCFFAESVEAFRFARSGEVAVFPINVLSAKACWKLRHWG